MGITQDCESCRKINDNVNMMGNELTTKINETIQDNPELCHGHVMIAIAQVARSIVEIKTNSTVKSTAEYARLIKTADELVQATIAIAVPSLHDGKHTPHDITLN